MTNIENDTYVRQDVAYKLMDQRNKQERDTVKQYVVNENTWMVL